MAFRFEKAYKTEEERDALIESLQKGHDEIIVKDKDYRAKRSLNNSYVEGFLVKYPNDKIAGILNKAMFYAELAWIDEKTLKPVEPVYTEEKDR